MRWEKSKVPGRGPFSFVFQAIPADDPQPGIDEEVRAMKCAFSHTGFESLFKEEWILEAFKSCPEILQCYGSEPIDENDRSFYNVMLEFAPHGTLIEKIRKKPFSESVAFGEIEAPLDIWSLGCLIIKMITWMPVWFELSAKDLESKLSASMVGLRMAIFSSALFS